jgi:glycosyltransferase involved in cell wall biosynthesis
MRILFDSTLFLHRNVGGFTRYFTELANGFFATNQNAAADVLVFAGLNCARVERSAFPTGVYRGVSVPSFRGSWRIYKALNDLGMQALLNFSDGASAILHETYYGAPQLWNPRVKRVITIHDMIWEEEEFTGVDTWSIRAKRVSAQRADGILFVSESTRRAYRRHFPKRCDEAVVHHGCELRTTRDPQPVDSPWPYILFVGRRGGYKNWSRMVSAIGLAKLWKTHGLINVGGALSEREMQELHTAGIPADRVRTLRCDDDILSDLYRGAECFVFPSMAEGFGIPLLEAARCGSPIACSDIPVFREILPAGPSFFDPRSPAAMMASIQECLHAGRGSRKVAEAKQAAQTYSWQRTADETLRFYRSLF